MKFLWVSTNQGRNLCGLCWEVECKEVWEKKCEEERRGVVCRSASVLLRSCRQASRCSFQELAPLQPTRFKCPHATAPILHGTAGTMIPSLWHNSYQFISTSQHHMAHATPTTPTQQPDPGPPVHVLSQLQPHSPSHTCVCASGGCRTVDRNKAAVDDGSRVIDSVVAWEEGEEHTQG